MSVSKVRESFEHYFQKIYQDRWPAILQALLMPEKQVARRNKFSDSVEASSILNLKGLEDCQWREEGQSFDSRDSQDLLQYYIMDPASVIAARSLPIKPGDRVLDLCAAPGGKSLILIESLGDEGEIICNDLSDSRRERLKKVIQQYVPRSRRDHVWVTGKDGNQFGLREAASFDAILLDAPCSGERHLLENEKALAEWSPRRSENLAIRQYSLLASAWAALKPGGHILYSTCSLNPQENDQVIEKLLKKKKSAVLIKELEPEGQVEKTKYGYQYLPDLNQFGPIFFALISKLS